MRTESDVLRSVRRYFASILGDAWEVREWSDEGAFELPLAKIAEVGAATYTSHRIVSDVVLPIQVFLYQEPNVSTSASLRDARALRDVVWRAVEVGQVGDGAAWPRRIPLYDYDGLTETQTSNKRNTYDFIRVLDLSLNSIQDSEVPTGVVVVADMRLGWRRDTTVDPGNDIVNSVAVTIDAS